MHSKWSKVWWAKAGDPANDEVLGSCGDDGYTCYPTDRELRRIRYWPVNEPTDVLAIFEYMHARWRWPEWGWTVEDTTEEFMGHPIRRLSISTGGWSGHEDMLGAFKQNWLAWVFSWVQLRRGGHYIFEVKL